MSNVDVTHIHILTHTLSLPSLWLAGVFQKALANGVSNLSFGDLSTNLGWVGGGVMHGV
jgi:hypothetical protein